MKKLIPTTAGFVYSNGCSDLAPYKRRREVYENVTLDQVRALAKQMGLVGRSMNTGDNKLFTKPSLDLQSRGCHLLPYIAFETHNNTESEVPVMEVWYAPEMCTQEEADRYFHSRTSNENKVGVTA